MSSLIWETSGGFSEKEAPPAFLSPLSFPRRIDPFSLYPVLSTVFSRTLRGRSSFTPDMAAPWPSEFGSSNNFASEKSFPAWRKARSYPNLEPKSSRKGTKTLRAS